MNEMHELMNVRVIRVTTEAALLSVPDQADAHRRRAAQLLDDAEQRTVLPHVLAEIDAVRGHVLEVAQERDGPNQSG